MKSLVPRPFRYPVALLFVVLAVQGCPSKPAPGVRFPITSGSHTILPATEQRILIWGDPPLADVAVEWLRAHHYTSFLRPDTHPLQASQIAHTFSTRTAALAVAREMKAEIVLFLDREATKDGALIEPDCGRLFHVTVEVRGLSVESGDTALRGRAHYPHCVDLSNKTIRSLTCQALATAWGFRPSGQLDIPSTLMCTAGQTEPIPIR
jgi:hypothetical protein